MEKEIRLNQARENLAPEDVRLSEFGCRNCLWAGIECEQGSKYRGHKALDGSPSCKAYTYYD